MLKKVKTILDVPPGSDLQQNLSEFFPDPNHSLPPSGVGMHSVVSA